MRRPSPRWQVGGPVDAVEILFEPPVRPDPGTVGAQRTFIIESIAAQPLQPVNPKIFSVTTLNAMRFTVTRPLHGPYRVRLTDKVSDTNGVPLDGEFPKRWPSGDTVPGGDFEFELDVN